MEHDNRIAELRKMQGLTQEALAEMLGTTRAQVANLERGARQLTLDWMRRLSHHLKCAPADLLADADAGIRLSDQETEIVGMWRGLPADMRGRVLAAARAFTLDCPSTD